MIKYCIIDTLLISQQNKSALSLPVSGQMLTAIHNSFLLLPILCRLCAWQVWLLLLAPYLVGGIDLCPQRCWIVSSPVYWLVVLPFILIRKQGKSKRLPAGFLAFHGYPSFLSLCDNNLVPWQSGSTTPVSLIPFLCLLVHWLENPQMAASYSTLKEPLCCSLGGIALWDSETPGTADCSLGDGVCLLMKAYKSCNVRTKEELGGKEYMKGEREGGSRIKGKGRRKKQ